MHRSIFLVLVAFLCASSLTSDEEVRARLQAAEAFYSDKEIQKMVPYDIEQATKTADDLFDIPCHPIVPSGWMRREVVFQHLGISENRLGQFRSRWSGKIIFLSWQVSPSFSVSCMTAISPELVDPSSFAHPAQDVYGIRFFAHGQKSFGLYCPK
jgi:hypothetical protein